MKFKISTKEKERAAITKSAINEISKLFPGETPQIINSDLKKENGTFELHDGRRGIILTQYNNTLSGKIEKIKEILKESGACSIYIPQELRNKPTVSRFASLITAAYDKIVILDSFWLNKKHDFKIPNGSYWSKNFIITTNNSTTTIESKTQTFYNHQEAGLLGMYFVKKHNHEVVLEGNINGQYVSKVYQEEWENNSILNKITHNSKKYVPKIKTKNNDKTSMNLKTPDKFTGSLEIEDIPESKGAKAKSSSRGFDNSHEILKICFSNYLRNNSVFTDTEFLDIDIVSANFDNDIVDNIYEVKTSKSEIFKAIGQLLTYAFRIEKKFGKKPKMNLVIPDYIILDKETLDVLMAHNIICIHFSLEKGIIKSN